MKVEIYSTELCGYCDMAKKLMEKHEMSYTEYKIGSKGITKETLLERIPNARTVPQIFIDNELIGGFTEFEKWCHIHMLNAGFAS